jgi:alkyldihydroxyacetonephosphate synthase
LRRYLQMRGSGVRPVMLMIGITGSNRDVLHARREALTTAKLARGVHAGRILGRAWASRRFAGPYLRNALWRAGYGADTVETAVSWPQATATMQAVEATASEAFAVDDEKVHVFTHISHVYPQGCSLYSTLVFRLASDHDATLERWQRMKRRLSETIVAYRGTISHQHGVGQDHAPYLEAEKGRLGMTLLRSMVNALDPQHMMNPGKLIDG